MNVCGNDVRVGGRLVRIARIDGDKYNSPDDPESLIAGLKNCGTRIDLFTFLQELPDSTPKYPYPMEWDNLAVLNVSTFEQWWTSQLDNKTRNMVRKAEKKNVVLREVPCDELVIRGICEIYNECPVRQGRPFPHYGMTPEKARAYAGTYPDRSIYIGAFLGDTMIGFVKLVTNQTRTHACLVHILSMVRHRDKAPTNALVAHAVRACAQRGISHLVYENFTYGKKQGDSLSQFKQTNGFRQMDLPRYYIPLTPLGHLAFRVGLHRRLFDHIPTPLADKLREFRKAWLERKFQSLTEI